MTDIEENCIVFHFCYHYYYYHYINILILLVVANMVHCCFKVSVTDHFICFFKGPQLK